MKNTILVGFSLLMVVGTGCASQGSALTYNDIVAQYNNRQQIADVSAAIQVVEEHCKNLKAQRAVYRPGALRMLGTGLGVVAGVGIIGSVGGAYGAYTMLGGKENSLGGLLAEQENLEKYLGSWLANKLKERKEYLPKAVSGLSYGEFLNQQYFGKKFPEEKELLTKTYLEIKKETDPMAAAVIFAGGIAPIAFPVSLLLAGLSKYLFNKAASYQDPQLEDLIAQDEKMLKDLKAMQ